MLRRLGVQGGVGVADGAAEDDILGADAEMPVLVYFADADFQIVSRAPGVRVSPG